MSNNLKARAQAITAKLKKLTAETVKETSSTEQHY